MKPTLTIACFLHGYSNHAKHHCKGNGCAESLAYSYNGIQNGQIPTYYHVPSPISSMFVRLVCFSTFIITLCKLVCFKPTQSKKQ